MKALLLALCLLASPSWAAIAPNTVALWTLDNVLTDSSGNGYTLTQSGTIPFSNSPAPPTGTYWGGLFPGGAYGYSAAARTALSGATEYTIEANVRLTGMGAQNIFLSAGASSASAITCAIPTDGRIKFVTDDTNVYQSAAGVVAVNTTYYMAWVVSGTNLKMYVGVPGATPTKVFDATAISPEFPTGGSFFINVLPLSAGFQPLNGYMGNIRLSNVARTTLPTTDDTPATLPNGWVTVNGLVRTY